MQRRTSRLALAAGFAVLLALAIALVTLTRGGGDVAVEPAAITPGAEARTPAAAAAGAPVSPATPRAPGAGASAPAASRRLGTPGPQPQLGPSLGRSRELKRDANGHLVPIITMRELRAQIERTTAPMQACIAQSGQRPSGKATLSFTVATMNGQLAIETTGVQDEDTLAAYPELLDCLHKSAYALVVDRTPVPALGTPIYVRRHVRIDQGELVENTFFDFSYNP